MTKISLVNESKVWLKIQVESFIFPLMAFNKEFTTNNKIKAISADQFLFAFITLDLQVERFILLIEKILKFDNQPFLVVPVQSACIIGKFQTNMFSLKSQFYKIFVRLIHYIICVLDFYCNKKLNYYLYFMVNKRDYFVGMWFKL